MLRKWDKLPDDLRVPEVRPYYDLLKKRRLSLFFKRVFDLICALISPRIRAGYRAKEKRA